MKPRHGKLSKIASAFHLFYLPPSIPSEAPSTQNMPKYTVHAESMQKTSWVRLLHLC